MENTKGGYLIDELGDVLDSFGDKRPSSQFERELWALVQAQEERIRELERGKEERRRNHGSYIFKAEAALSDKSARLAEMIRAAKAGALFIRNNYEFEKLRAAIAEAEK